MGKKLQLDELGQLGQSGQNVSLPVFLYRLKRRSIKIKLSVVLFLDFNIWVYLKSAISQFSDPNLSDLEVAITFRFFLSNYVGD